MKLAPLIVAIILTTVVTLGCTDQPNGGNGGGDGNGTTYASFTNGEFYVEYPSDWSVFTENQDLAGITTENFLVAEKTGGAGVIVRGHKESQGSALMGFDEWYDSSLEDYQNSEDSTVIDYEKSVNEAFIEYTFLSGGAVTVYSKNKFIACADNAFLCISSVENILRSDYQDQIDHIISSFTCVT